MPESARLYLDTNIFIAAFEAKDQRVLELITEQGPRQTPALFTSELTMAEAIVLPLREGNDRLARLYDNWTITNQILEVGEVSRSVLSHAADLRAQYPALKLPDAIHVSTAIGFECTHFVSFDRKLRAIKSIERRRFGWIGVQSTPKFLDPREKEFEQVKQNLLHG